MLGWWPLDDLASGQTEDLGPDRWTGTALGNTTLTTGYRGKGLYFDGDDDGLVIGDIRGESGFTLMAWVKQESFREGTTGDLARTIWHKEIDSGGTDTIGVLTYKNYLVAQTYDSAGGYGFSYTPTDWLGVWHHLVVAWSPEDDWTMFIDGVKVEGGFGDSRTELPWTATPITVGIETNFGSRTYGDFHGVLDELAMLRCAIDEEDAARAHSTGWPFEKGAAP